MILQRHDEHPACQNTKAVIFMPSLYRQALYSIRRIGTPQVMKQITPKQAQKAVGLQSPA